MQKKKSECIQALTAQGVVAVLRQVPKSKIIQVAESLISGGINALEITVDTEDAYNIIKQLKLDFKDDLIVGAGTVLDDESAELALQSGAEFIVSPILKSSVIKKTLIYGKISIPGVMTPTEMVEAVEQGADIVKLFPATVYGPKFIKTIKGPLPDIPIIPTGGIDLDNATEYIKAGAVAIGAGGHLINKKIIAKKDFKSIAILAAKYVDAVKKVYK